MSRCRPFFASTPRIAAASPVATVIVAACLVPAACSSGCSGQKTAVPEAAMRIEDVPPELMKIAQKELPDVKFDTVWRKPSGTLEIRGKAKNGKIREVEVRPDGSIEEVE